MPIKNEMEKINDITPSPERNRFEQIDGYTLEVFSSQSELEAEMEVIRKSHATEVAGFVRIIDDKFCFYFQESGRVTSSEIPPGLDNSWHSHPDTVSTEAITDAEEIPDKLPANLKQLGYDVLTSYKEVDESSPNKPSLIDLINIVDHQRDIDRISLPGLLLEIRIREADQYSDIFNFSQKLTAHWEELVQQIRGKITDETTEDDIAIYRIEMVLSHYRTAINLFSKMLKKNGFNKMGNENWLELLQKIGTPVSRKIS